MQQWELHMNKVNQEISMKRCMCHISTNVMYLTSWLWECSSICPCTKIHKLVWSGPEHLCKTSTQQVKILQFHQCALYSSLATYTRRDSIKNVNTHIQMPGKQSTKIHNWPHYSQEAKKKNLAIRLQWKTPGNSTPKKTNICFKIIKFCWIQPLLDKFKSLLKTHLFMLALNK